MKINKRFSALLGASLVLHAGVLFYAPGLSPGAAGKTSASEAKAFSLVNIAVLPETEIRAPRKPEPKSETQPLPEENSPDGLIRETDTPPPAESSLSLSAAYSPESRDSFFNRYAGIIRGLIDKNKEYPYAARRQEQEGAVQVRFTLSRGGRLVGEPVLEKSCRHQRLNAAALEAVRRAQPYPAFPQEIPGEEMTFSVTVAFSLK
jgi:protein TonB